LRSSALGDMRSEGLDTPILLIRRCTRWIDNIERTLFSAISCRCGLLRALLNGPDCRQSLPSGLTQRVPSLRTAPSRVPRVVPLNRYRQPVLEGTVIPAGEPEVEGVRGSGRLGRCGQCPDRVRPGSEVFQCDSDLARATGGHGHRPSRATSRGAWRPFRRGGERLHIGAGLGPSLRTDVPGGPRS
jgi:hypothetical protein